MTAEWVGAIAGAVAASAALLARWPGRWIWRLLRGTMEFLEDWKGEPARPGFPARPGVPERLENVEKITAEVRAETQPNGGTSLRDVVHRTAADVAELKTSLGQLTGRVELFEQQREIRDHTETIITRPARRSARE